MDKQWFNSILFSEVLEYMYGLSKSINGLDDPIENPNVNEDQIIYENDLIKRIFGKQTIELACVYRLLVSIYPFLLKQSSKRLVLTINYTVSCLS